MEKKPRNYPSLSALLEDQETSIKPTRKMQSKEKHRISTQLTIRKPQVAGVLS